MFSKASSKRSNKSRGSHVEPGTPLQDLTNKKNSTTSSSFLPELNSTPPMPTFQKPSQQQQSNVIAPRIARPASGAFSPTADPGSPLVPHRQRHRVKVVGYAAFEERLEQTPPLPKAWRPQHDRAVCIMDSSSFELPDVVSKMRRAFRELDGEVLTPQMVDKR